MLYKGVKLFSVIATALVSAACVRQVEAPQGIDADELSFNVEVDNPYFIYHEPSKSELVSEDGSFSIPLTCKVTEGMPSSGLTKGTQFEYANLQSLGSFQVTAYDGSSKLIDNKLVKYYSDGSGWLLQDNPKMWKTGHTLNFFAYANMPTGSSISAVSSSSQTFSCTIQSTAANQKDALLGYYSGTGSGTGSASIKFNHPLTAVVFKIGAIVAGDKTHTITGIQSVTLKGVYASGTATATGSGDVLAYNWGSSRSAKTNVSEPLTGPVGTVGDAFILIPQNLATDNVTLEAVLTTASGTKNSTATLKAGEWQAGKTNTYVLGYTDYISVESISLNKSETTIKKTDSETLVATVLPVDADDKTVTWTTSDPSVATVNAAGQVTAVGVGTCQITATPADGVAPATCIISVINPVVNIVLDNEDLILAQTGEKNNKTLVATVTYYDGTVKKSNTESCVTWTSTNENVASVTPSGGLVLANVDKGTSYSTIRATTIDLDENGNPMTAECSLNVPYFSIAPTCYITNGTSTSMYTQEVAHSNTGMTPVSIKYYVDNTYGGNLEYVVLDNDATGLIHGHYVGQGRVYAVADYGNGILNTSNDCIVTVGPAESETETLMDLTPAEMCLSPQEEGQATVNMRYHLGQSWQYDQNVNWTTSNSGVAVVNALGIVTGIAAGTCTVTATSQYESTLSGHVSQTMTVIVNNEAHITLNRTSLGMLIGDQFDLTARVTHTDGSKDDNVSWSSSNTGVATVSNTGHVVAIGEGSCTLTARSNIDPSITQTCAVSVTSSSVPVTGVTLNKSVIVLAPSATGEVTATIAPSSATNMEVTWTSSNTNVFTVTDNGLNCTITAVGVGKAYVTVTTDDGGYQASCAVLVPGLVIPSSALTGGYYNSYNGAYLFGSTGATTPFYYSLFPAEIYNYVSSVAWTSSNAGKFTIAWDGAGTHSSTATVNSQYSFSDESVHLQITLSTGQMLTSNTLPISKMSSGSVTNVDAIAVSPTSINVSAGTLTAIAVGCNNLMSGGTHYGDTNVKWSSSNDEIAVVVNDGGVLKVRALKKGSCTITAAAAWKTSLTASISVTVN